MTKAEVERLNTMTQIAHAIADQKRRLDGVDPVKIVIRAEQPKKKWWQWWKK